MMTCLQDHTPCFYEPYSNEIFVKDYSTRQGDEINIFTGHLLYGSHVRLATVHQFPSRVSKSLLSVECIRYFCIDVLISLKHAITSEHCFHVWIMTDVRVK